MSDSVSPRYGEPKPKMLTTTLSLPRRKPSALLLVSKHQCSFTTRPRGKSSGQPQWQSLSKESMNTKAVGEITVAKVLSRFVENGEQVALPFGDNQRYDLVLMRGRKALRVQCKTAHGTDEFFAFRTCSQNPFTNKRRDYQKDVELFAVYYPRNGKVYVIPIKDVTTSDSLTLRLTPSKNLQRKKVRLAKDFEY